MSADVAKAVSQGLGGLSLLTSIVCAVLLWRRRELYPLHAIGMKVAVLRELSVAYAVIGTLLPLILPELPCYVTVIVWNAGCFPLGTLVIYEGSQIFIRYQQNTLLTKQKNSANKYLMQYLPLFRSKRFGATAIATMGLLLALVPALRLITMDVEVVMGTVQNEACSTVGLVEAIGNVAIVCIFPACFCIIALLLHRLDDAFRWSQRYKVCASILFIAVVFWQVSGFFAEAQEHDRKEGKGKEKAEGLNENAYTAWATVLYASLLYTCSIILSVLPLRSSYRALKKASTASMTTAGTPSETWTASHFESTADGKGVITTAVQLAAALDDRELLEDLTLYLVDEFCVSLGQFYAESLDYQMEPSGRRRNEMAKNIRTLYFSDSSTMQVSVSAACKAPVIQQIDFLGPESPGLPPDLFVSINLEVLEQLIQPFERFCRKRFTGRPHPYATAYWANHSKKGIVMRENDSSFVESPLSADGRKAASRKVKVESPHYAYIV